MERSTRIAKISGSCNNTNGIDRISNLPDEVLHNILSSLCIIDVVQLGVLSKRWEYLWTTMPYLHFDLNCIYSERIKRPCDLAMVEKLKYFINWVLISQTATKLVRFILCSENIFDNVVISGWIRATTRRNVQRLVLGFRLGEPFELPYCLATCESLRVLKLNLSKGTLKLPDCSGFRQLKLLHLEEVKLSGEHLTNRLFSKCNLLESLILEDCSLGDMTLLDIASASLIDLTLVNDSYDVKSYANCEVKITCPNLKLLRYGAPVPKDIILVDLFSVEAVHIFFLDCDSVVDVGILVHNMIKEVASTSVLKLCMFSLSRLYTASLKVILPPVSLHKLKFLRLNLGIDEHFMQVMILLLKYSPNLEALKLWSDENGGWSENLQLHDPDESIACLESHLKSIELSDFKDDENEMELLRFFLKNARVLEKLTVIWASYADKSEEATEEVLKFPRTSSRVVVTFLDAKPWQPRSRIWYNQ